MSRVAPEGVQQKKKRTRTILIIEDSESCNTIWSQTFFGKNIALSYNQDRIYEPLFLAKDGTKVIFVNGWYSHTEKRSRLKCWGPRTKTVTPLENIIRKLNPKTDAILLDQTLNGSEKQGRDIFAFIRKENSKMPVVSISNEQNFCENVVGVHLGRIPGDSPSNLFFKTAQMPKLNNKISEARKHAAGITQSKIITAVPHKVSNLAIPARQSVAFLAVESQTETIEGAATSPLGHHDSLAASPVPRYAHSAPVGDPEATHRASEENVINEEDAKQKNYALRLFDCCCSRKAAVEVASINRTPIASPVRAS